MPSPLRFLILVLVGGLASTLCAADEPGIAPWKIVVSVKEQKMVVLEYDIPRVHYPVSTSKYGLGDRHGSMRTPLGLMRIAQKIGHNAPSGAVFKSRRRTGEILPVNAPGRDPIVTRILWLEGLEARNSNAYRRMIYIHGTPEEKRIGEPVSYGCVRMRSQDVIDLFNRVPTGTLVEIQEKPLPWKYRFASRKPVPAQYREPQAAVSSEESESRGSIASTQPRTRKADPLEPEEREAVDAVRERLQRRDEAAEEQGLDKKPDKPSAFDRSFLDLSI